MLTPEEIGDLIVRLRAEGKALEGDGFSHVGNVKGAVKRACVQLESLQLLLANPPAEEKAKGEKGEQYANPACYGEYGFNVPGCECRRVFESFYAKRSIKR
jgi:hypothetical protein